VKVCQILQQEQHSQPNEDGATDPATGLAPAFITAAARRFRLSGHIYLPFSVILYF
jgi:flagellar biosynthesis protein FliP